MWAIKLNLNRTVKEQDYGTIAGKEMNPGNGFFKLISFAIFNCKKDHPNVYIGYYSLPDWLSVMSEHIIKVSFVVSWLERFLHLRLFFFSCAQCFAYIHGFIFAISFSFSLKGLPFFWIIPFLAFVLWIWYRPVWKDSI